MCSGGGRSEEDVRMGIPKCTDTDTSRTQLRAEDPVPELRIPTEED